MKKECYEKPDVWFVSAEASDVICTSSEVDVGVDGSTQNGWWL